MLPGQTASAIPADEQRAVPAVGLVVLKEGRKKKTKVKVCGSIAHPKYGEKYN